MSSAPSERKPVPLGRYEVTAHIARGGMGSVYRGRDRETGQDVAIKILSPELAANPRALERFRREARAALRLRHPNVVTVHEFGEVKGIQYLAMEFVDGIDLQAWVQKNGRLTWKAARLILVEILKGLESAHQQGIVHRDVKPSNVLIVEKSRPGKKRPKLLVKVTDFGLAREVDEPDSRVTTAGFTVGTIDYISPEQARDSSTADPRSDLYSVGCTLFFMLTGQPPFAEGTSLERLFKHRDSPPPDVRKFNPDVPGWMIKILDRLLEKKPEHRFQTAGEVIEALQRGPVHEMTQLEILLGLADGDEDEDAEEPAAPVPACAPAPAPAETRPVRAPVRQERPAPVREPEPKAESQPSKPAPSSASVPWWKSPAAAGGAMVAVVAAGLLVFQLLDAGSTPAPRPTEPVAQGDPPGSGPPPTGPQIPPTRPTTPVEPIKPRPVERGWPALNEGVRPDVAALTRIFQSDSTWPEPPADAPVFRVSRWPSGPRHGNSLQTAVAEATRGKNAVIEIDDNGPLFLQGAAFSGCELTIRAAPGRRPLIFWDAPAETDFLSVSQGSLTLQGIELATVCEGRPEDKPLAFVRTAGAPVRLVGCTFSAAGTHAPGLALVRSVEGDCRLRLSRCYARGRALAGLVVTTAGKADLLVDDCLLSGGELPLIEARCLGRGDFRVRLLRSTLVNDGTLIRVQDGPEVRVPPLFRVDAWDCILARAGRERGGTLLEARGRSRSSLAWQPFNCLYPGWRTLLAADRMIDEQKQWMEFWELGRVDRASPEPWPGIRPAELEELPALRYRSDGEKGGVVGYAATSWPCLAPEADSLDHRPRQGGWLRTRQLAEAPVTLGAAIHLLPPAPPWKSHTLRRQPMPAVNLVRSSAAPPLPEDKGGPYPGGRIDISQVDVGAFLGRMALERKLAPRVVLHLHRPTGTMPREMTPIRLRGVTVVLYLEPYQPPKDPETQKERPRERLALPLSDSVTDGRTAFIDIEDGALEVLGGDIVAPDFAQAELPPWIVRVSNGALRLCNAWLIGPGRGAPDGYRGLVLLEGQRNSSGEPTSHLAAVNSVLTSGRAVVGLSGDGAAVRAENVLLVSGGNAVVSTASPALASRPAATLELNRVTWAARTAVVRLDQPASRGALVWQAKNCACLQPFGEGGAVVWASDQAFRSGALIWQGEGIFVDRRWRSVLAVGDSLPSPPPARTIWQRTWGPLADVRPAEEHTWKGQFDERSWALDRLILAGSDPPGADLGRLGIKPRPARPR